MAYKIIISLRAQKEIENAIDYYVSHSAVAPVNFISILKEPYNTLEKDPFFFRVRYKIIRALKLKRFPYSLYFVINESHNTLKVLSCFHNKGYPDKKPRF